MAEREKVIVRVPSDIPLLNIFRIFDKKIAATLIDDGEKFENGNGSTPNHDKVTIIYPENK